MSTGKTFKLQIVTQNHVLVEQDVQFAIVPTAIGPIGVLPGHAPLLGIITIGALMIRDKAGKEFGVFVGRGFFMVSHEGVTVVVRVAETEDQIDASRARSAYERSREMLAAGVGGMEAEQIQDAVLRAKYRMNIAEKKIIF